MEDTAAAVGTGRYHYIGHQESFMFPTLDSLNTNYPLLSSTTYS